MIPAHQTSIEYVNDKADPAIPLDTITTPEDNRLHAMVAGPQALASPLHKLLIWQDLIRGEGLAVLDPYHDLVA